MTQPHDADDLVRIDRVFIGSAEYVPYEKAVASVMAANARALAAERRIVEVREEEREACAKIFLEGGHELWMPEEAAEAIRSRSQSSTEKGPA